MTTHKNTPKIPKAGQCVIPLKKHTVRNSQGKIYTYRRHRLDIWFNEPEVKLLEIAYNYIRSTKHPNFTEKERSTLPKFLKAILLKYSEMIKKKYIDRKWHKKNTFEMMGDEEQLSKEAAEEAEKSKP